MFKNIVNRSSFTHIAIKNCMKYNKLQNINVRELHKQSCLNFPRQGSSSGDSPSPAIAHKYRIITEDNSQIIENTADEIFQDIPIIENDEFEGINLKRGVNGVFEIEDIIELLERENSKDICVISPPKEINYVDYIVIVSGKSPRHILALAEFVRRVYKQKCHKSDRIPRIEGKGSGEWMALDLGNIALHVFSSKSRAIYDIESLWAVGREYDDQVNKKSDVVEIFQNYSAFLKDLKPLS